MAPPNAIFFSYTRSDGTFARRLASDLRSAGIPVWIDQLDIQAGERWDQEVQTALRETRWMLVVLSSRSVESPNVLDEISYALNRGVTIIPVLYEQCDVPLRLTRINYIEFLGDYSASLHNLLDHLRQIGGYTSVLPPVPPGTTTAPPTTGSSGDSTHARQVGFGRGVQLGQWRRQITISLSLFGIALVGLLAWLAWPRQTPVPPSIASDPPSKPAASMVSVVPPAPPPAIPSQSPEAAVAPVASIAATAASPVPAPTTHALVKPTPTHPQPSGDDIAKIRCKEFGLCK